MGLVALAAQDSSVQASQQVPDIAETRAVADRYCVTCHNPRTSAGHLDLTSVDFARPGEHAAVFEKVIAKLRAGLMPPAGQRQPNADERTNLVTYLETHLDAAPEAVLQVAASTPPGRWLKVTAPMDQSGPNAVLSAATPTEKPAPKPRTSPRAAATVPARASASIPPTVKANGGISGSWELRYKDQLRSTHYMACELAQDGPLVGGSCDTPGRGTSLVRGDANGSDFTLQIPPGGLVYAGTVDATGTIIRVTLVYLGVELNVEATKTTG